MSAGPIAPALSGSARAAATANMASREQRPTALIRVAAGFVLALLMALCLAPAIAQVQGSPQPLQFRDEAEARRFHALTQELRCVKCQNQSLADSNAQIALDLRREVLELIHEGRSDAQIKQFLVDRYGEFVLYRPRVEAHTWLLWFGPAVLLLAGGVVIARLVRGRGAVPPPPADDEQEW